MRYFLNQTVRIKRLKTSSGNKMDMVATATADCSIQPIGKEGGEIQSGVYASTFICYVEHWVPAQMGDQVVDGNNVHYTVTDVILRDVGAFPYKEIIMKKSP